jgi:UDPglucose 6-dehydrogenase
MDLAETVTRVNRQWPERLFAQIRPDLGPETTVAVLGLAYKPATQVVEESQSIDLVRLALKAGVKRVVVYDPLAGDEARAEFGKDVIVAGSARECVAGADVVVISTPDPAFRSLRAADFKVAGSRPVVVFDCWRLLREELACSPGVVYKALGIGGTSAEMTEFLRAAWSVEARAAATAPGD